MQRAGGIGARGATAPRRLPRRRPLLLAALAAVLAVALAAALLSTAPRLAPVDERQLTADAMPTLEVRVQRPLGIRASRIDVKVGDAPVASGAVTVSDDGSRIMVQAPRLSDGVHDVDLVVRGAGLLRTRLHATWQVEVDTTAPDTRVASPTPRASRGSDYVAPGLALVTQRPAKIVVATEADSELTVTSSASDAAAAVPGEDSDGRRELELDLPDGRQVLTVRSSDPAGNETVRRLRVLVDTTGPATVVRAPRVVRDAFLALPITASDPLGVRLQATLDGRDVGASLAVTSTTPAPFATTPPAADDAGGADEDTESAEASDSSAADPVRGAWRLVLDAPAFEGRHVLRVVATDSNGASTTVTRRFVVDSGDDLGAIAGMRDGAVGGDVRQLQEALVSQGMTTTQKLGSEFTGRTFGANTGAAVRAFQQRRGMQVDGVAGSDTVAGLTLKIVIDRGAHTLTLLRLGKVVKSYGIAVGSPKYPTPAGSFSIQTKERNPTWTPPDSDWAKDAKVTPPGPDNPLGTRWMAIYGTVGIHGTNSPASIGYSVSHGCIRMKIPDVEELFDMVEIGTPVTVV